MTIVNALRGRLSLTIGKFRSQESGAVAIYFALSMTAVAMTVGASIDYGRMVGGRERLQSAVDSAVLAAIQAPAANRVASATAILAANLAGSGLTASWTQSPTLNADGSVTAAAKVAMPTTALGIIGTKTMTLSAQATAKLAAKSVQSPTNVTFTLTGATGWYWKQVDLYTHQPGAASDALIASYTYQPTNLNNGGTGTSTAQFSTGPGGSMTSGAVDTPVSLGSTYDKAYLVMTVYSDGCGPGFGPQHSDYASNSSYWNPFTCMAVGSTWTSTSTTWNSKKQKYVTTTTTYTVSKSAVPVYYSTDDATSAHNLFVNGVELPDNVKPNFFSLFDCSASTKHDWEDTPWANPLPGTWSQQDIHFTITATCGSNGNIAQGSAPALVK
ncbi:MAG: pilus assembly protein [Hyphomicrobiales bacterium]|nr:pilus assembly protein [Hyphomicrobiales bacterium]